ncbi:hypothetical protein LINGRAPRIM_LOCUS797 [Linum grandiflorum]
MFGKFGWQLLTDNTTLVARILKARYYPHGDFLSAELGSNPSLTWRSMVEARLVVKLGHRWKVGDGKQIRVWTDPWVQRKGCSKISSTSPIDGWDLQVSAFILPNGEVWMNSEFEAYSPHKMPKMCLLCR